MSMSPISIRDDLLERVDARIKTTKFDTKEEYINYVLDEVLYIAEEETSDRQVDVDEQEVEQRLKSLGYLKE